MRDKIFLLIPRPKPGEGDSQEHDTPTKSSGKSNLTVATLKVRMTDRSCLDMWLTVGFATAPRQGT